MKRKIFLGLAMLIVFMMTGILSASAEEEVKSKFPLKIYGFLRGEMTWADSQVVSLGESANANNRSPKLPAVVLDETTVGKNDAATGFTANNTRLGLEWAGTEFENGLTAGGKLELDFLDWNNTVAAVNPQPRMRLAYAELKGTNWSILGGQNWDVFSPLNVRSLLSSDNMWFSGNLGFRRPQFRFTYNWHLSEENGVTFKISVNNPGNDDVFTGEGVNGGVPYFEGSINYFDKWNDRPLRFGISGVAGSNRVNASYENIWGIAGDVVLPFYKYLQFQGEFAYGQRLGHFLTVGRTVTNDPNYKTLNLWGQLTSQWHEKFETNLGYGIDDPKGSNVATGNVNRNTIGFLNAQFSPVSAITFGVEYGMIRTAYKGTDTSTANYVLSAMTYKF